MIVAHMRDIAQNYLGEKKVKKGVITVPAYFNDSQRQVCIVPFLPLPSCFGYFPVRTYNQEGCYCPRTSTGDSARATARCSSDYHNYFVWHCITAMRIVLARNYVHMHTPFMVCNIKQLDFWLPRLDFLTDVWVVAKKYTLVRATHSPLSSFSHATQQ